MIHRLKNGLCIIGRQLTQIVENGKQTFELLAAVGKNENLIIFTLFGQQIIEQKLKIFVERSLHLGFKKGRKGMSEKAMVTQFDRFNSAEGIDQLVSRREKKLRLRQRLMRAQLVVHQASFGPLRLHALLQCKRFVHPHDS